MLQKKKKEERKNQQQNRVPCVFRVYFFYEFQRGTGYTNNFVYQWSYEENFQRLTRHRVRCNFLRIRRSPQPLKCIGYIEINCNWAQYILFLFIFFFFNFSKIIRFNQNQTNKYRQQWRNYGEGRDADLTLNAPSSFTSFLFQIS